MSNNTICWIIRICTIASVFIILSREGECAERPDASFRASQLTYVAAHALDTASSWGRPELNPLLPRGNFGPTHLGLKAAYAAGFLAFEEVMVRRHPRQRRLWKGINYAAAVVFCTVAARNFSGRQGRRNVLVE